MSELPLFRLLLIVAVAVGAHVATVAIRAGSRRILRARLRSEIKVRTITGFLTSVIVFSIYFAAGGIVLSELGISLATYVASASVIGLAVSFGSQGVVQDMITGLTLVFSDLIDVGDMVDIGGQVGIVEGVGMRFTVLVNFSGAHVFVPNRNISNVINYPKGYVRAFLDARVPEDGERIDEAERKLRTIAQAAHEQFPGILLLPPTYEGRIRPKGAGTTLLRIKFRIWPGQGAVVEGPIKASIVQELRALDPGYADWMVTVHYRAEPTTDQPDRRLPRPSAIEGRSVPAARDERPLL